MVSPPRASSTAARHPDRAGVYLAVVAVVVGAIWSLAAVARPPDSTRATDHTAATAPAAGVSAAVPGPSEAVPPGLRKKVQRWVTTRDQPLIRMNNALVPIVFGTLRTAGPHSVECRRLDASIRAVRAVGRSPNARVHRLAVAGLADIQRAARACLAGDLDRTRRWAKAGLAKRAAVSLELDEALEGE